MKELILDGSNWITKDDFYDAFFKAVGAPEWHGRNFNALNDSIATGSINQIEVPYKVTVTNYDKIIGEAKTITDKFIELVNELAVKGCPIQIQVQ